MLLHSFIFEQANLRPDKTALEHKSEIVSYQDLALKIRKFANGLANLNLTKGTRVGVFLPKQAETVIAIFGSLHAGACIVPINPVLKAEQVQHVLNDCDVNVLVTSEKRLEQLNQIIKKCPNLKNIVITEETSAKEYEFITISTWNSFCINKEINTIELEASDLAAIFYTSGSTGMPKGVVLTHENMCVGAKSVASYLNNSDQDRILALLPLSFDYGFSQLTTAFSVGATIVLLDYLLPKDVLNAIQKYRISGLAGIPSLWSQLVKLTFPGCVQKNLRYITNSGGAMPEKLTNKLSNLLPKTDIYLMYGLTEAFRSTYLPPNKLSSHPTSIGKAIPNAELFIINEDNEECPPEEIGELVHAGSLVAKGYWDHSTKTVEKFKPLPDSIASKHSFKLAVRSGDLVKKDKEGYLYFIGRKDEMIKTSGYRVSPSEIEDAILQFEIVKECAAFGVPNDELGQAIIAVATCTKQHSETSNNIIASLKKILPGYMIPKEIIIKTELPININGKIDRDSLRIEIESLSK
ncbi:MAG: acyl-CoA ligase (AMP-forming), exosortase A system-associated [Pseudomonadota bacterium]